ncbi:MAG: aspartate aminotransferase family protein [bacterium]|nr:aspartate aminotransferase family protein [bacterium]
MEATELTRLLETGNNSPLWQPFTDMQGLAGNPFYLCRGEGIYVYDQNDRQYIDAAGALWNMSLGLGQEKILDAMKKQMDTLVYGSLFRRSNPVALQLAAKLKEITPANLTRTILTCTGSQSVEAAIKVVRSYFHITQQPVKKEIVCLKRSYHGTYYGSGTASDLLGMKEESGPNVPGISHIEAPYCYRCPYGMEYPGCGLKCAEQLEKIAQEKEGRIAAFMMEPILGSGGILVPPKDYFERIAEICKKHNIFLMLDEVATGFGRTGEMFAADLFGIQPDVLILSKSINSGYLPLGATLFCEEIFRPFIENNFSLQFGSTQDGNPVCCASSLATMEIIKQENLLDNCKKMGAKLKEGLNRMIAKSRHIGEIRGEGLMIGVEMVLDKETKTPVETTHIGLVVNFLMANGLLVYPNPCGFSMFPPLNITEQEVEKILTVLGNILLQIRFEG